MEILYIVDLKVEPAEGSNLDDGQIYDRLVEHTADWLSRDLEGEGPDLSLSGESEIPARRGNKTFLRTLRWNVTKTERVRSLKCIMHQPVMNGHDAQFICEITIFQEQHDAAIRIELGRESSEGLMSPVSIEAVRRPGILASAVRDTDLRLTYQGQVVDNRYDWIKPGMESVLTEVLDSQKRLPILLVDGGNKNAKKFGSAAAAQLAGLARVLLIGRQANRNISQYLEGIDAPLPYNEARLIWPILSARHPEFWNLERTDDIINTLMKIVAPVSVSARGVDKWRIRIAEENRRVNDKRFQEKIAQAAAQGGSEAELETLRHRVNQLDSEVSQWVDEVERLAKENESLTEARVSLSYWRNEAERLRKASLSRPTLSLDENPPLNSNDLSALAKHLEEASGGSIAFTAKAMRNWPKSGYPHVDAMEKALVGLTRASIDWRNSGTNIGKSLRDWLKTEFELNFSPDDESLRRKSLDVFDFEGIDGLSREPHLKLDDHVKPNEVGRVYFAVDSDQKRFIVDHVGLKLYGI